jgi:5-carboxymethyl-2-hydroxymuconate isomerase
MPHLVVEYSANLEKEISIQELVHKVHEAALATGVFELAAIRTRAERREIYAIADGHDDNSFVAVRVAIGKGRTSETRKQIGKAIFDVVCNHMEEASNARPIAISLEVQQIDPTAAFRKNNLHSIVRQRAQQGTRLKRASRGHRPSR